jgi:hypothetical protein
MGGFVDTPGRKAVTFGLQYSLLTLAKEMDVVSVPLPVPLPPGEGVRVREGEGPLIPSPAMERNNGDSHAERGT